MEKMPRAWITASTPKPTQVKANSTIDTEIAEAPLPVFADGIPKWWQEMSDEGKEDYVAEHPASKYAELHTKEKESKGEKPAPKAPASHADQLKKAREEFSKLNEAIKKNGSSATDAEWAAYDAALEKVEKLQESEEPAKPKAPPAAKGDSDDKPSSEPKAPAPKESKEPERPKSESPAPKDEGSKPAPAHPESHKPPETPEGKRTKTLQLIQKDMANPTKRAQAAGYLKKKSGHVVSHLKKTGVEWKTAGSALKGLTQGKAMTKADKHALAAVAADIALVSATVLGGGGAAHGVAAFMKHFGVHMVQDMLIKAAVMGTAAGHADHGHDAHGAPGADPHGMRAPQHAKLMMLSTKDPMEEIVERALKMMTEALEKGDLEKYVKKAEAQAQGRAGSTSKHAQQQLKSSTEVKARIDMSADVVGRGLCPECRKPMIRAFAGSNPVWTCAADRITLPLENGQS